MKFDITPVKTYATEKNAEAAVIKKFHPEDLAELRWFITEKNGRFFPIFVGEKAITYGAHFRGFCIVG